MRSNKIDVQSLKRLYVTNFKNSNMKTYTLTVICFDSIEAVTQIISTNRVRTLRARAKI